MSRNPGRETRGAGEGNLRAALLVFATLVSCGLSGLPLAAQSGKATADTRGAEEFFRAQRLHQLAVRAAGDEADQ